MKLRLDRWKLGLDSDQLLSLREAKGVRLFCLTGALWVTQEQSSADVVLEAGDSMRIEHPGLTLVMALSPSTLRVCEARKTANARGRLLGWLRSAWARPNLAF